jgi:Enoyl-CoA hydratase/carnithine racemase
MPNFVPTPRFEDYSEEFKEHLHMSRHDGVIEVAMHTRGGHVRWGFEIHRALWQAFKTIGADPENEVMILTGTDDAWIGRFDEESFGAIEADPAGNSYDYGYFDGRQFITSLINSIEIPTIGAINGPGGHMELGLMCDITICSDNTVISDPHYAMGMVPGDGIHSALIELLGVKRAAYAMFTNQQIDAQKALEYGLVNEVVPRDQLMDRAREIAAMIMGQQRMARKMTTQIVRRPWRQRVADDLDQGFAMEMWAVMCTQEHHENSKLDEMPWTSEATK